jgi:hypothetical protein
MKRLSLSAGETLAALSKDKSELLKLMREESYRNREALKPYPRAQMTDGAQVPTSWAQQRLWFIDQLEGGTAAYNIVVSLRMRGSLNQMALQGALDTLVQRHEVLRTVFVSVEGDPKQEIRAEGRFELKVVDLNNLDEAEREAQVQSQKTHELNEKFDLRVGPLCPCGGRA